MVSTYVRRLTVYRDALAVIRALEHVARNIPSAQHRLRDQLRRSASSIALNLAEGADEFSPAEKARIYRLARRSASECVGNLDVLSVVVDPSPDFEAEHRALARLIRDISALISSVERRAQQERSQSGAQEGARSGAP